MNTKYDPIETAKRHLRDCMESPDYPVHNCYVTCNDVAYLLAEAERLRAELAQEQFNIQQATEHLVDYAREIERLKSGQHTINIAGTSSESAGTVTIPCGYAAEVGRLRAALFKIADDSAHADQYVRWAQEALGR